MNLVNCKLRCCEFSHRAYLVCSHRCGDERSGFGWWGEIRRKECPQPPLLFFWPPTRFPLLDSAQSFFDFVLECANARSIFHFWVEIIGLRLSLAWWLCGVKDWVCRDRACECELECRILFRIYFFGQWSRSFSCTSFQQCVRPRLVYYIALLHLVPLLSAIFQPSSPIMDRIVKCRVGTIRIEMFCALSGGTGTCSYCRRVEDGFTGSQYSIRPMIWLCRLLLDLKTAFLL